MTILDDAATASLPGNALGNRIDYLWLQQQAQLTPTQAGYQKYQDFASVVVAAINAVRARQAVLQALEDTGLTNEVTTWLTNGNYSWATLVLTGPGSRTCPVVRSSHAGNPIDMLLPQAPYATNLAPGALPVNGVLAPPQGYNQGVVGRTNWQTLLETTTVHTQAPNQGPLANLPKDQNRVASYFEITLANIKSNNSPALNGGRLVYDPFNRRYFVSDHYATEYEVINIVVHTQAAAYSKLRQELTLYKATARNQQDWSKKFDAIYVNMSDGEY